MFMSSALKENDALIKWVYVVPQHHPYIYTQSLWFTLPDTNEHPLFYVGVIMVLSEWQRLSWVA